MYLSRDILVTACPAMSIRNLFPVCLCCAESETDSENEPTDEETA